MATTTDTKALDVLLGVGALACLGGVALAAYRNGERTSLNAVAGTVAGSPPPKAWNAYATWVLYAVLGRLADADGVMRGHRADIYAVASYLQKVAPVESRLLHRGLFLLPSEVIGGNVKPDPNLGFVSFSEDKGVACWFADRDSSISGFVAEQWPDKRGYLVEHTPASGDVLFHHTWRDLPGSPFPPGANLTVLARMHPHIAPQAAQFDWALKTQREVIVKPMRASLRVTPVADAGCPDTAALEARLGPDFHWTP